MSHQKNIIEKAEHRLERITLIGFLITFMLMRTLVYLIMSHTIPNSYVFAYGLHIHHFNEGIFILALLPGCVLFARPQGLVLDFIALLYGIALALTFDEFGMWLKLNVAYWQRISIDMVFIITTVLGILAYRPKREALNLKKSIILVILFLGYAIAAHKVATSHFRTVYGAELQQMQLSFHGHS